MRLADIAHVFLGRAPTRDPGQGAIGPYVPVQLLTMRDVGLRLSSRDLIETVGLGAPPDPERLLRAGDIVVTSRGRLRAAVAEREHEGVLVGPNLILVRLYRALPPHVLAAYLRHPVVEEELLAETSGTGTPGLSLDVLKNLVVRDMSEARAGVLAELVEQTEAYRRDLDEGVRRLAEAATESVFRCLHGHAS